MKKMHVLLGLVIGTVAGAASAVSFSQSFTFATPADQALWTVTTNNDANGPGVPQYGVPDPTSVRIEPIDASTKNTGDIRLYNTYNAPAGYTASNLKLSGIGMGYSSHITWADLLLSQDGVWGTSNTDPDVVRGRASSGYDEVPILADASANPLYSGLSSVYLQIRIVDALGILNPATASPYARAITLTGELTPVPEPATLSVLAAGLVLLPHRRRR
jgi:hypothetical protein